ncbi:MAG TPA: hypothetical protein VFX16_12710 [Pseudonocardiaceae bacterium]|nr:hypothetical protein [Pseudonocardiaceae bacterium]
MTWVELFWRHVRGALVGNRASSADSEADGAADGAAASRLVWLSYWPGLALVVTRIGTVLSTMISVTARTVRRARGGWAVRCAAVARWAEPRVTAWCHRLVRAVRWSLAPLGRLLRWAAVQVWRVAGPLVQDGVGWLLHRAPRLLAVAAGRLLVQLARWLPAAVVRLAGYAAVGAGWLVTRTAIYCAAYPEYAPLIALAHKEDRPRRVYTLTQQWRRAALRRCSFVVALGLLAWLGWTAAGHAWGTRAHLLMLAALTLGCATVGRTVRPRRTREDSPISEPDIPENAPYPVADAHTRAEATDCVARALAAEGIALRLAGEAARARWGWTVPVILRTGTPAAIVAKTGELETHLDLPAGGVLATPDRTRRARVVLRLAQTDPFVGLGYAPTQPPSSLSITERITLGRRIDGEPLTVPLLGVHGVVIGSPGSGKSTTLLALGEGLSVCADAVLWDLDPAGDGLRVLGPAVGRRERDPAAIEDTLADALALAEVRPRMLADLGMGAAWEPSPQRPAVVVIVDEYPRLTGRAKQFAVQLLRVGRKARVTLILAATEATSDALGAAIADTTALKILHACRFQDIQLVLGPQMGAEGWRPDRLHPATADDPGDAGRCYVATAGHREPLLSKVAPVDIDRLADRVHQRAAFGLPCIDADSWDRARARRIADRAAERGEAGSSASGDRVTGGAAVDHQGVADLVAAFGVDRRLWTEELLARLADRSPRYEGWSPEDLAALLRPLGIAPKGIKRDGINRNGYNRDDIATANQQRQSRGDRW